MNRPQGVHLVGSINLDDADTTFRTAAALLGSHLKRIPDGEVGERFHWIGFQADRIARANGIVRVGDEPRLVQGLDFRPVAIKAGMQATDIVLGTLGYADAALDSFRTFTELKTHGIIPEATRFQVSLPTPLGVVGSFVAAPDRAAFEPVYEAALTRELHRIVAEIPNEQLAVQWDAALEFSYLEGIGYGGPSAAWFDNVWAGTSERLARHISRVPEPVEVGVHLCYGDVGETHFTEPTDAANLTRFSNLLCDLVQRPLTWIHLPVPITRTDAEYFAPLTNLAISPVTELYLGLVHRQDGVTGALQRIHAARRSVTRPFGVATECGFGRAPRGSTIPLFETLRTVAAAW